MSRQLTARSSLENLKREAKRWLNAIRANDASAREKLAQLHPDAPAIPTLRDVQHALAADYGFTGWNALKAEVTLIERRRTTTNEELVEALLRGADQGDVERVAQVLDAAPDLIDVRAELTGHSGVRTALHYATTRPSRQVIELLLERGANPNIRDEGDNAYPIHFLAERGELELVRLLVESGADPVGEGDDHLLGVIGWAVGFDYAHHVDVAEYLLANGGRHNIHSATAMGDAPAIRAIVGSDTAALNRPMDRTNLYRTPLHLAVVKKQQGSLRALIELGAALEAEDAAGMTALDQAALLGVHDAVTVLLDVGARLRLPAAVALNRVDDIERLMRDDPYALRRSGRYEKLIVRAAERSSGAVIDALVRLGASVHVRDDARTSVDGTHGYTALHAAAFYGNLGAALALLKYGANPMQRDKKYQGTPAGWANYARKPEVRDAILAHGPNDIFDAMAFDRLDELPVIVARDPDALERPFRQYMNGENTKNQWYDPEWTPLLSAVVNRKPDAVRLLLQLGADASVTDSEGKRASELTDDVATLAALSDGAKARPPRRPGALVADFLTAACLDWRESGSARIRRRTDATRMLDAHPEIAAANIYSAVVCGEVDVVRTLLDGQPQLVSQLGGPRTWPPILYLCDARLARDAIMRSHVPMLALLLERGADPNAFYSGGNLDIHYTAFTCVMGLGEEQALMHPHARELVRLLLEHGADPHDSQVLYNVFADHASRNHLTDDIVWLLDLMYVHSVRRGHADTWKQPEWPHFSLFGAPSLGDGSLQHHGSHFMLSTAVRRNLIGMARWCLEHGASPNTTWGEGGSTRSRSPYEQARVRGRTEMVALFEQFGAHSVAAPDDPRDVFVRDCLQMNRAAVKRSIRERPDLLSDTRAMFAAIDDDRPEVVAMLLDLGMSPNVESADHWWPLHRAAGAGRVRCAQLLIDRGADVDVLNPTYSATPLSLASWAQQPATVALLGKYSRDVWQLVFTGHVQRLRELVAEDATLARIRSRDGSTPLMWLPDDEGDAVQIVKLFLANGADVGARNERGESAADIARRRGMTQVVKLLEESAATGA